MTNRSTPARACLIPVVATLAIFACGTGRAAAAEPDSATVKKADKMVRNNDKLAMFIAYPTHKRLTDVELYSKSGRADGSFTLTYTYEYLDSDGDEAWFQFHYDFNAKGEMTDVRPGNKHSSFWPPLFTSNVTLGLLKEMVRNDKELKDTVLGRELQTVKSAAQFLVVAMNANPGR